MRSSAIKTGLLVLAIAIGGIATPCSADAAPRATATASPKANVQRARKHFLSGKRAFERRNYILALKEFEAGYAIEPRPGFLLNMAHASRRLGDLRRARGLYIKFLATDPPVSERQAAARAVGEIDRELPAEAKVGQAPAAAPSPIEPAPTTPSEPKSPPPSNRTAVVEAAPGAASASAAAASTRPAASSAAEPVAPVTAAAEPAVFVRPIPAAQRARRTLDLSPRPGAADDAPVVVERKRLSDQASAERSPPIYRRWWFWAGAGGVAAGVATAILIGSLGSGSSARDSGTWGQIKL